MNKARSISAVVAGGLALVLVIGQDALAANSKLSGDDLNKELQSGGYVIYIRHAQTEKDYADQVSAEMGNCATQRALSEAGWEEARAIGAAFMVHQIPVGKVISSEYCRA